MRSPPETRSIINFHPQKTESYDIPAISSAKFGEIIQRNAPQAKKTFLSAISMGLWLTRSNFATRLVCSPTPQGERAFLSQNARDRRENAPKKSARGGFGTARRGQKWHFPRVIGNQKRAPHRRKIHPQKRCAKNGPKYGSKTLIVYRFLGRKLFRTFSETRFF